MRCLLDRSSGLGQLAVFVGPTATGGRRLSQQIEAAFVEVGDDLIQPIGKVAMVTVHDGACDDRDWATS